MNMNMNQQQDDLFICGLYTDAFGSSDYAIVR
jgi:hypothetical protein